MGDLSAIPTRRLPEQDACEFQYLLPSRSETQVTILERVTAFFADDAGRPSGSFQILRLPTATKGPLAASPSRLLPTVQLPGQVAQAHQGPINPPRPPLPNLFFFSSVRVQRHFPCE